MSTVTDNEFISTSIEYLRVLRQKISDKHNSSKLVRITSIITGSIAVTVAVRNLYVKYYRKFKKLPTGPYGLPFLGQAAKISDPYWGLSLNKYGSVVSVILGPLNVVCINNPYLIKKIYADPRTQNNITSFAESDVMFITINGSEWEKRRKIVYAKFC